MTSRPLILALAAALLVAALAQTPPAAEAHQPFCEFADLTADTPWHVEDPSVSVAFYGNLYPADDVDYFTFEVAAGQSVYLQMTVPDIDGQNPRFVPALAVSGPGLERRPADLPSRVELSGGVMTILMVEEPDRFFEPFGGNYYWMWQSTTFKAPEAGTYTVAVWHPEEQIGRYTFVVGKREVIGGDIACLRSFGDYWTPLREGHSPYQVDQPDQHDDGHEADDHPRDDEGETPAHDS